MNDARIVRLFLVAELAVFLGAAMAHFTSLTSGRQEIDAGTAETLIAIVLLAGLIV